VARPKITGFQRPVVEELDVTRCNAEIDVRSGGADDRLHQEVVLAIVRIYTFFVTIYSQV